MFRYSWLTRLVANKTASGSGRSSSLSSGCANCGQFGGTGRVGGGGVFFEHHRHYHHGVRLLREMSPLSCVQPSRRNYPDLHHNNPNFANFNYSTSANVIAKAPNNNSQSQSPPSQNQPIKVKRNVADAILESLSSEDVTKILNIVNEVQRPEDLLKYYLPKKKAEELIKVKAVKGEGNPISSLEEIVAVVGPKNSTKFICSVLERPIPMSMNAAMFPPVTQDDIKRLSNVLSVVIVGDKISWSTVKRSVNPHNGDVRLEVGDLEQVAYQFKPRMHVLALLKEMELVAKQIPDSELCITEEYPVTVPTPYMFNFQLQMAQAKSLLIGLLRARPNPPVMISIKTVAVARIFNTFVGSERVSGQHIVEDLLNNRLSVDLAIQNSTLDYYNSLDVKIKEGLSHTFLLNMSYWKLTKQIS